MSGILYYLKYLNKIRNKKKDIFQVQVQNILKPQGSTKTLEIKANSTYLFGSFRMYDRNKKDISYLFSPKIRQLFLLLLFGLLSVESSVRAEVKVAGSLVLRADDCLEGLELIIALPRASTGW